MKIIILGITFEKNCPDIRRVKVIDVWRGLKICRVSTGIYDSWGRKEEVLTGCDLKLKSDLY